LTVSTLILDDIELDVVYKDIKNVHLSVHPPTGRVRISAPREASPDVVRAFAVSKIGWIRRQQRSLREQEREPPREYIERESHYLWGKRYLLTVEEHDAPTCVESDHRRLILRVRRGSEVAKREAAIERWYRDEIRRAAPALILAWEQVLSVRLKRFYVQRMKTMWGSCTSASSTIRLNTELAKKPIECLEYIIAHELTHLREPNHGAKFVEIMDTAMPTWRSRRDQLNDLPVRHENWRH
jgi:predicted metal-dependent hydrolase